MAGKKKEQRRRNKDQWCAMKTSSSSSLPIENAVYVPPDEWFVTFKENVLDQTVIGKVVDGMFRNFIRTTCDSWTRRFASIPALLLKNSLWLQLLLIDEDRVIHGKFYVVGAEVAFAEADTNVVQRSRNLLKEAIPCLLQGASSLVFSRSSFLAGFNGSVDDAVQFPLYDPLNWLKELPQDMPSGVRCTEAFLFLAGDFPTKDGFCSREAILELLHELNSPEGIKKTTWVLGMCCKCQSNQGEAG